MRYTSTFALLLTALFVACSSPAKETKSSSATSETKEVQPITPPAFNADSAYHYVATQVEFGYRIPNTPAHKATARYLAGELERHGAEVQVQEALVKAYDNTTLEAYNIIGSFAPEKENRVLLFAHWDSRPYADHDPNPANYRQPIDGANDGASGVGVLLEVARQLGKKAPNIGVDIILFDAEDYGKPTFYEGESAVTDDWALGTQYWTKRPHIPGYRAKYGILLDMVGGKDAIFAHEYYSKEYAPWVVEKVWKAAQGLGHDNHFVQSNGSGVLDDHYYVNRYGIPSIDIIQYDATTESGFYPHWHTVNDTMEQIDPETLAAVGETLLWVLYNE